MMFFPPKRGQRWVGRRASMASIMIKRPDRAGKMWSVRCNAMELERPRKEGEEGEEERERGVGGGILVLMVPFFGPFAA